MRPFRRFGGRYTATFDADEVTLLADLVDQVRQLLAGRRSDGPTDPLVAVTGMTLGPPEISEDPALARLLPDFHHQDAELSAALRVLREPEIIAAKDAAAVALLDSLPRGGGRVQLGAESAKAWVAALNDVRLALGVRLEIAQDDDEPAEVSAHPDGPTAAAYLVYRWLTVVQDSLVTEMLP